MAPGEGAGPGAEGRSPCPAAAHPAQTRSTPSQPEERKRTSREPGPASGAVKRYCAGWVTPWTGSIDVTWPLIRSTVTRTGNFPGPRSKVS